MVFYLVELNKELEVAPRFFGPKLRDEIDRRLRHEVRPAAVQSPSRHLIACMVALLEPVPAFGSLARADAGCSCE